MMCCFLRLSSLKIETKLQRCIRMGITIFKIFIWWRHIIRFRFGNHVLWLRLSISIKLNFRPYIRQDTSPNENFEYRYPLISCSQIHSRNTPQLLKGKQTIRSLIRLLLCEQSYRGPYCCQSTSADDKADDNCHE